MRLHGYCTRCHKIRRVTITGAPAMRGVVQLGICADCENTPDPNTERPTP